MQNHITQTENADLVTRFQKIFATRDFIFHDGSDLRRFTVSGRVQALLTAIVAVALCFAVYGAVSMAGGLTSASDGSSTTLARMRDKVAAMRADMDSVKKAAAERATRVETRQALITAVLSGTGDPAKLNLASLTAGGDRIASADADRAVAPFRRIESRQTVLAAKARQAAETRYRSMAGQVSKLGLHPGRFAAAVGGPYEPVDPKEEAAQAGADSQFRSLFMAWKKLDTLEQAVISIPSRKPVQHVTFSSTFGVRSDPFNGHSAMHTGVDIPGPRGTPVYATADGIVDRAGRNGGYGNMIEINHGRGIQTRYGHLSKILVKDNERVHRGEVIARMGSTGRSTGSHLHYEVRIDDHAVNPVPYLQNADYMAAVQDRAKASHEDVAAMGGPAG